MDVAPRAGCGLPGESPRRDAVARGSRSTAALPVVQHRFTWRDLAKGPSAPPREGWAWRGEVVLTPNENAELPKAELQQIIFFFVIADGSASPSPPRDKTYETFFF